MCRVERICPAGGTVMRCVGLWPYIVTVETDDSAAGYFASAKVPSVGLKLLELTRGLSRCVTVSMGSSDTLVGAW